MSVEKRYSKRYPVDCDVYIRYRKQRAFPAQAEDCSLYGMYLKTENLTLLTGAMVELDIFLEGRNWEITGLVTHTQKNGLGVMFWEPQAEFYAAVIEASTRNEEAKRALASQGQIADLLAGNQSTP
jgi:hypothetical protein